MNGTPARMFLGFFDRLDRSGPRYVLLGIIILVASFLRFYKLGEWSFWVDEIYTLNRIQSHYSSLQLALENIPPQYKWFPLSLLLTSVAVSGLGVSEWSVRLVPALIGIVSVPVLWMGDFSPGVLQRGGNRAWFVVDSESVWVTGPIRAWTEAHSRLVNVWTLRVPEDISLRLYLYDPGDGE